MYSVKYSKSALCVIELRMGYFKVFFILNTFCFIILYVVFGKLILPIHFLLLRKGKSTLLSTLKIQHSATKHKQNPGVRRCVSKLERPNKCYIFIHGCVMNVHQCILCLLGM